VPATQGFQHYFIDQEFQYMYEEVHRVQSLTLFASGNAIALACMGLFGLASYAMQERRKEIGVRKTLGASVSGLITLVSREFIVLVLVAAVIAAPIAWNIMRGWLDNFAYRTDLGPLVFIFGSAIALIIAQLTITFHAYRAAQADPVLALRDE
jgi:putative ABC transport system permease protein